MAEATVVELFREDPDQDLGLRIVGGKDTPLGNIVIQEIVRDSLAARDGKLAPGDHILEVRHISARHTVMFVLDSLTMDCFRFNHYGFESSRCFPLALSL